jgi:class 3 adenylate cyclase
MDVARGTRLLAWSLCAFTLLIIAGTAVLAFLNRASIQTLDEANAIEIVLPIGYAILGGLVGSRKPANALGWLFLAIALGNALPGLTTQYGRYASLTNAQIPFTPWIPWLGYQASSLVYPAGLAPIALMLIPNGRFLSPRWRWVAGAGVVLTVVLGVLAMLDPRALREIGLDGVPNPTGMSGLEGLSQGPIGVAAFLAGLCVLVAAGTSVILRLFRARGEERLQLRWVAYSVAFAVALNVGFTVIGLLLLPMLVVGALSPFVVILGFGVAMPVGFAVAILRHRLYDLDLLLNRTILYGTVSAVLLVAFVAANILAQGLLQSWTGQRSDLVAAVLGLAAGLAFAPVRRWLRPFVDRALPARSRLSLLFTDIVESTQAIVNLGDEQWRGLLERYRSAIRQELTRCRGREQNTAGDAFFAVFDRPANAVRCAVAIRAAVAGLGLRVRTGLHVGDVEMRGEQVSGLAVHAAARIMGEARAGEIVISADLADALEGVPLRDAGAHALRGVPGEWRLFEITA